MESEPDSSLTGPCEMSGDELAGGGLGELSVDGNVSGAPAGVEGTVGVAGIGGTSSGAGEFAGVDAGVLAGVAAVLGEGAGVDAVGDDAGVPTGVFAEDGAVAGDNAAGDGAGVLTGVFAAVGDFAGVSVLTIIRDEQN